MPWRTFRWYKGQKHYSGLYWSATTRTHVAYESRLELARLPSVESRGWRFEVAHEPPEQRASNIRFLAGYRRDWLMVPALLDELREADLNGLTLAVRTSAARYTAAGHIGMDHACAGDVASPRVSRPTVSAPRTLWESKSAALGSGSRPSCTRPCSRTTGRIVAVTSPGGC